MRSRLLAQLVRSKAGHRAPHGTAVFAVGQPALIVPSELVRATVTEAFLSRYGKEELEESA